jgi:tyrosyl-DNA phosphodiesterase-1
MFGTHHTKMMILFRHDDTTQVIIHTANLIARDWRNMTQAAWQSPFLPYLASKDKQSPSQGLDVDPDPAVGSGEKFKIDLLGYLKAYDKPRIVCRPLVDRLGRYDFSTVRGALIGSVPGRHKFGDAQDPRIPQTIFGWAALKEALRHVPVQPGKAEIVAQVSSIATLGPTESWLRNVLFAALNSSRGDQNPKPEFKVVFPTPDEIRRSLDGYGSGASIHTKIQSQQQAKQLQYLKPIFHHWANDADGGECKFNSQGQERQKNIYAPFPHKSLQI